METVYVYFLDGSSLYSYVAQGIILKKSNLMYVFVLLFQRVRVLFYLFYELAIIPDFSTFQHAMLIFWWLDITFFYIYYYFLCVHRYIKWRKNRLPSAVETVELTRIGQKKPKTSLLLVRVVCWFDMYIYRPVKYIYTWRVSHIPRLSLLHIRVGVYIDRMCVCVLCLYNFFSGREELPGQVPVRAQCIEPRQIIHN